MTKAKGMLVLMTALALGGCDITATGQNEGSGMLAGAFSGGGLETAAGNPADRAAAAATAAALNGLIGSGIGSALDDTDRRLAYAAQIDALDRGAPGAPIAWRNPESGRRGNIVAGPLYSLKGAKCRGYSHTVTFGTNLETVRKTACRNPDGSWTAVS
ncbi:MAG TPA: RT0821/Lpp0805 family surface protein [Nitrobacter sp.]|nr:RT0821/Lpp0805 family surface protein [Nitrobacter sp.]